MTTSKSGHSIIMRFQLNPPLVSIIVLNYNYGQFLRDALESVKAQTYKSVECIVVDDASTDESHIILDWAQGEWPNIKIIKLKINSGQSAAALAGLAVAKGDYVLFLDADDILFDECVAFHLSVHMSSRRHVGFSCCDAVQIVGDRAVIGHNGNISAAFMRLDDDATILSDVTFSQLAACGINLPIITWDRLRHVPADLVGWPWSTTSSMFFRREALDLVCGAKGLTSLRIATDNYLAHAINLLTGSVIFDLPLVGYRLHGRNGFNKRPALDGFICHNKADEHFDKSARILLDDLIERFGHYSAFMSEPERILEICLKLDGRDVEPGLHPWAKKSRFAGLLQERRHELEMLVGPEAMAKWIARARLPLWIQLGAKMQLLLGSLYKTIALCWANKSFKA